MDMVWRIVGYVCVVIVMIAIHRWMRRHHTTLARSFVRQMDGVVAHYSQTLRKHRSQIHQYEENVPLLFRTMDMMLHDRKACYHTYMGRWLEDVSYAQSLLPEHDMDVDTTSLQEADDVLDRMIRIYRVRGIMIAIVTVGLYLLRWKPLHTV